MKSPVPSSRFATTAVQRWSASLLASLLVCATPWHAQEPEGPEQASQVPQGSELDELSLEDLLELEVSVAGRHDEQLSDTAAAVYVITGDELRRSGHKSLQDALRMVPGFHVNNWKTSGWDVTARGFTGSLSAINESFANQLLLIVDGVDLYNPIMSGIWWPLVDVPLQDIDRIEVLRGPAGTLWGANAMNGVVHVITKHARDTQGVNLHADVGTKIQSADHSVGRPLGDDGWLRAWASWTRFDALPNADDVQLPEDWWIASAGARADWDFGADGRLRAYMTLYTSEFGEDPVDTAILSLPPFDDTPKNGGRVFIAWEKDEATYVQRLQAWYLLDHQKQFNYESDLQVFDFEWSQVRELAANHTLTLGAGARLVQTNMGSPNGYVDFSPEFRRTNSLRAFAQDEYRFESIRSALTGGLQVEHSTLGDFQVQPNVRWRTRLSDSTMVWAAISRAVRTPSFEEVDIQQYDPPTDPPFFHGNEDFESEELLAHEFGLRSELSPSVFADLALFYNDFESLQSLELDSATGALTFGNRLSATAAGAELALDWQLAEDWRLRGSYTYFEMNFEGDANSFEGPFADAKDGLVPTQHVALRSYYDLSEDWDLDAGLYWVSPLDYFGQPEYLRVDVRLGWRASENVEVSFGVQNATEGNHTESGGGILSYGSEIEPNVYLSIRTRS
jgi:iron complex outermembrane recepter protein